MNKSELITKIAEDTNMSKSAKAFVLFSPLYNQIELSKLAEWILEERLPVRFQVQLHKVIWGNKRQSLK